MRNGVPARKSQKPGSTLRAEALRQQVCAAASGLFTKNGYGSTSMQDIADALKVSRPTLYYYFRNKNEILEAVISEVTIEAQRRAEAATAEPGADPIDTIRRLIADHADLILTHPVQFRMLQMSATHLTGRLRTVALKAQRSLLETFTRVIRHGVEAGSFHMTVPRIAAFALLGMCNWTCAWYKPGGRLTAKQIATHLAEMGANALARNHATGPKRAVGLEESLDLLKDGVMHLEFVLRNSQGSSAVAPVGRAGWTAKAKQQKVLA